MDDRAIVRVQGAIRLDQESEPQPDLAILAPSADDYGSAQPAARDVLLVIEVADSTLRHDREVKLPLYARHGIPEAWLVDLQHQQLHICRFPGDGSYRDCRITREPGVLEPVALPGVQLDLGTLLAG